METDFLPLHGTDYIKSYVGDAKQAAHDYKTAFRFQGMAYAGLADRDNEGYPSEMGESGNL
jgi:hypothetical protein